MARWPLSARIGLYAVLIGIACFGGWACWDATRIWVPLNVPISLAPGHIRAPEFKINVESGYDIQIEVNRAFDFWGAPCVIGLKLCNGNPAPLGMSWSLSNRGRVLDQGSSKSGEGAFGGMSTMGRVLGRFDAGKGVYALDLDVLQDGSRLNGGAPRLMVLEAGYQRQNSRDLGIIVFLLSLLAAAAGTFLIVRAARARRRAQLAELARAFSLTQPGPQPGDLRANIDRMVPPIVPRSFHPPASACVGTVLILTGSAAYAAIQHWIATRILVPVDTPVSLAAGHIRTGPFRINTGEDYTISLDTDTNRPPDASCVEYSALTTRWLLYRDGQLIGGDDEDFGGSVGVFRGAQGVYDLDVEVLKDASCLNSAHPRLRVSASTNFYAGFTSLSLWLCTICMGAGGVLLTIASTGQPRKSIPSVAPGEPSETVRVHFQWKRKASKAQPLSGTPFFGLLAAITLMLGWLTIFVLQWPTLAAISHRRGIRSLRSVAKTRGLTTPSQGGDIARENTLRRVAAWTERSVPRCFRPVRGLPPVACEKRRLARSKGLEVHLVRLGIDSQRNPGIQPVLVRVEFDEPARRPHLYVDSRPVSWEDFAAVLQNDLNRRPPNWPVYFQGDPEMEWQWAVTVIDTIGGLHAEVILLTPASAPAKAPVSRAR